MSRSISHSRTSRRAFLAGAAASAGALVIGASVGFPRFAALAAGPRSAAAGPARPNAFIRIAPDNSVTVIIKHLDMGQGTTTGLATIVADELDADWAQIRTEFAPAHAELYSNAFMGAIQELTPAVARAIADHPRLAARYPARLLDPRGHDVLGMAILSAFPMLDGDQAQRPPRQWATLDLGSAGRLTLVNVHPVPPKRGACATTAVSWPGWRMSREYTAWPEVLAGESVRETRLPM